MRLTVLSVAYPLAPVGPDAVGGAEQILTSVEGALVALGHHSIVVASENSRTAGTLVPIPMESGPLDAAAKARAQAACRQAIAEALNRWPVDLIHLHGVDFGSYLPERGPVLVTLHLPIDHYPVAVLRPRPGLWFHAVSASQHCSAPPDSQLLPPIPNGVDIETFNGRHAKRNFAFLLSRICPEKGVHLGLDAADQAGLPLIIAGRVFDYHAHRHYYRLELEPRLHGHHRFLGPLGLARKRRFLAAARCLLVPSLIAETSSLVAMEALASGTPVIAFPNGALPEVVEDGRTGFIVRDASEMARAVRAADTLDPAVCRQAARNRFSRDAMIRRYLSLYERLLGGFVAGGLTS